MKKIENVLISGGAGFIGSNLSLHLIEKGYNVTVLDNLSNQVHGDFPNDSYLYKSIKSKVNFIKGDVRNKENWEKSIYGQDAIIHLAAETGTGQSMYQINKYTDVNIGGSALILDILANQKHQIKKLIVASSRAIYGEGRYNCQAHGEVYPEGRKEDDLENGRFECLCPYCGRGVTPLATQETSQIKPQSIYGISKYTQEQLFLTVGKSLQIPTIAFRYQNVFGPGQSLSNPYTGILSIFSTQIKNNNPINIYEDGKESRDFVYIDDVVNATTLGLESEEIGYNTYNVGSGNATNVLQIAQKLIQLYNSNVELKITGDFRLGDIRTNYADLNKIRNHLRYIPQVQFDQGLKLFIQWVNSQSISKDLYNDSISELKKKGLYK